MTLGIVCGGLLLLLLASLARKDYWKREAARWQEAATSDDSNVWAAMMTLPKGTYLYLRYEDYGGYCTVNAPGAEVKEDNPMKAIRRLRAMLEAGKREPSGRSMSGSAQ